MLTDYASTAEAADPYCLRDGEAAALLAEHPWQRFAVVGDSVAEGIGDPITGYVNLGWADRLAAELVAQRPDMEFINLGTRNLRVAQVRGEQLATALTFEPDLALIACGGNDALRPGYKPEAVDREITAIIEALRDGGAEVMTIGMVVMADYPAFPAWFRAGAVARLRLLAQHTNALAAAMKTIHADLSNHPVAQQPELTLSRDGLHANARTHAICAAEAIRCLGAHLGNTFTPHPSR